MKIFILTDYKGNFGSKWGDTPYRSGFNKSLLTKLFNENNLETSFLNFSDIKDYQYYKNKYILYTSSEDDKYKYKSYIEDVILNLELNGAILLPSYKFLRANNNKSFMALLEHQINKNIGKILKSYSYGTYEDLLAQINKFQKYPVVVKESAGAMSKGVFLAKNSNELIKITKKVSQSKNILKDIKDKLRSIKHKGYQTESVNRNKFVIQEFVPNLKNDWKIIIFGNRYYVLTRHVKNGDFRASGSHYNYLAGSKAIIPDGLLNYAEKIFTSFEVPHLSIDVVYDGKDFYLIEYQALYFGTSTYNMSDVYFIHKDNSWLQEENNITIEQVYVDSVVSYIKTKINGNIKK